MTGILVTGGTGTIGMFAVAKFRELGFEVTAFDTSPGSDLYLEVTGGAPVVQGTILDRDGLDTVIKEYGIVRILHLAAALSRDCQADPAKAVDLNGTGLINIFEVALANGVERVCWTSSIGALGIEGSYDGRLVDESYRVSSTTPYGVTKYLGEVITGIYREKRGLDINCVRPVFAFGLGKLTGGWNANYNRVIYDVAMGRPTVFPGWASTGLQAIYNKDQAALCVAATLAPPSEHWLFNTPTEQAFTEDQFIAAIKAAEPSAVITRDMKPPFGSTFPPNVDGSRAERELGFARQYTVTQAVREMIDYYRAHPDQELEEPLVA